MRSAHAKGGMPPPLLAGGSAGGSGSAGWSVASAAKQATLLAERAASSSDLQLPSWLRRDATSSRSACSSSSAGRGGVWNASPAGGAPFMPAYGERVAAGLQPR